MHRLATIAALGLAVAVAGCGSGLYSRQEFNVQPATGQTLRQLVESNGPPDVQGRAGNLTLVGWRGAEGLSVHPWIINLPPLFATGSKPSYVALADPQGRVVSASRGRPGSMTTILGVHSLPVWMAETKE